MPVPFIAVHAGAGHFCESTLKELKQVCKDACRKGTKLLKEGVDAVAVITTVISVLEDSPFTNAGLGSCLSLHGTVECDASIMRGDGACAVVGAVKGVRNPIEVTHKLLLCQSQGLLSLGRIPPLFLCGDGARLWAENNGVSICHPDTLVTDSSKEIYLDHISRLDSVSCKEDEPVIKRFKSDNQKDDLQLDTVGAVCIDTRGVITAGCSSGGISLKHPGRIGQAGVYGCGCWAEGGPLTNQIATSTSGTGECLIRTMLAKEVASSVLCGSFSLHNSLQKKFIESPFLTDIESKHAGVIVLHVIPSGSAEFSWAHSTDNMLISYCTGSEENPKIILSEFQSKESKLNNRICVGGVSFKL